MFQDGHESRPGPQYRSPCCMQNLCELNNCGKCYKCAKSVLQIFARGQPVSEWCGVYFNKSSTVDKNFRSHMTHGYKLGSVFQTIVVLLQNLCKYKTVTDKHRLYFWVYVRHWWEYALSRWEPFLGPRPQTYWTRLWVWGWAIALFTSTPTSFTRLMNSQ